MKGLLLKDWYMMKKHCKLHFFLIALCFFLSLGRNADSKLVIYPCVLCGMIPNNLLGYDEQSRWTQYSGTLPYTRAQIVSAKYLFGLLIELSVLAILGLVYALKLNAAGNFVFEDFLVLIGAALGVAALLNSIDLLFTFKLGAAKGRIFFLVSFGIILLAYTFYQVQPSTEIEENMILTVLALVGIAAYFLSWGLSIIFYNKREIA